MKLNKVKRRWFAGQYGRLIWRQHVLGFVKVVSRTRGAVVSRAAAENIRRREMLIDQELRNPSGLCSLRRILVEGDYFHG